MKRKNLLLSLLISLFFANFVSAQDTIVAWTFPSNSANKRRESDMDYHISEDFAQFTIAFPMKTC